MFRYFIIFLLTIAIVSCTTGVPKPNPTAANYNVELALSYLQQGNLTRAKYKLLLAQQQAPNDPVVNDAMGYFLERTGEVNKAESYYLQAINAAPKSGAAQNNYGTFLCRQKHYQKAITHFML